MSSAGRRGQEAKDNDATGGSAPRKVCHRRMDCGPASFWPGGCSGRRDRRGRCHGFANCPCRLRIREPDRHAAGLRVRADLRDHRRAHAQYAAAVRRVRDRDIQQPRERRPGERVTAWYRRRADPGADRRPAPFARRRPGFCRPERSSASTDLQRGGRDRRCVGSLRLGRDRRSGQSQADRPFRRHRTRRPMVAD